MRDDFMTSAWADGHGEFGAFMGDLLHQTRIAFERLAARTFEAPWKRSAPACGHARPKPIA